MPENDDLPFENMDFIERIEALLDGLLEQRLAIKGLTIGSHGGTIIASKFRPELDLTPKEMVAATTSLLFISRQAILKILDEEIKLVTTFGQDYILLGFLTRNITFGIILERNLIELDGIDQYIDDLKEIALRISAIIETSDVEYGDIFSKIKITIPDASIYAITTREGLPIKIQAETLDEARLAAFISAIFNINDLITHEEPEFTTIVGEEQSIIIHSIDKARLLAIAVPTGDNHQLMKYVLRIKALITEI
ncbi:hypothetical protein GF325_04750 [Candidatus Bathyarchaeota archaeon]|nr:hypothetical protein [Candidatus Bathyarchaeota archaeon]